MRQKWSFGYLLSFSPFNCHGGTKAENFHGECVQLQIPRSEAFLGFFIPNYQSQVKTEWVSSVASTNRLNHSLILRGPMTGTGLISFTCGPQSLTDYEIKWTPLSWPHPLFAHEFLQSKKWHLCILKSQRLVLNVPTSERKHIAFPIVVLGRTPQCLCVLTTQARPGGCQVLV